MTISDLARTILLVNRRPISKVRFARVIYYVHKELVRKKIMSAEDIVYVRAPLGPLPKFYLSLEPTTDEIISQHNESSHLSYTDEEYKIDDSAESEILEQYRDTLKYIERTLKQLNVYSTPELVELSHREPSWLAHSNGEEYFITAADLRTTFPVTAPIRIKIRLVRPPVNKSGAMQANLLRGMLNDIVRESTDLEHPDQPAGNLQSKSSFRVKFFDKWKNPSKKSPKYQKSDHISDFPDSPAEGKKQ